MVRPRSATAKSTKGARVIQANALRRSVPSAKAAVSWLITCAGSAIRPATTALLGPASSARAAPAAAVTATEPAIVVHMAAQASARVESTADVLTRPVWRPSPSAPAPSTEISWAIPTVPCAVGPRITRKTTATVRAPT